MAQIKNNEWDSPAGWIEVSHLVFVQRWESTAPTTDAPYRTTNPLTYLVADPGSGNVQWDDIDPSQVATVSLSSTDRLSTDLTALLSNLAIDDRIVIEQAADRRIVCVLTGVPQDQTGWFQIPVTVPFSTTNLLQNNKEVNLDVTHYPADSIPQLGEGLEVKINQGDPWALYRGWYDETPGVYHTKGFFPVTDISFIEVK